MPSPPPPVFVDARTIRPGMTGVGHYVLGLLRGLVEVRRGTCATGSGLSIRAAALPGSLEALKQDRGLNGVEWVALNLDYESHPWGDLGLRFRVPRLLRAGEVYHGPAFILPGGRQPFPRVVTIHDLGVFIRPEDSPRSFASYLRWCIRRSVATADRIIVPTEAVAGELTRLLSVPRDRMHVVHEAPTEGLNWPGGEGPGSPVPGFGSGVSLPSLLESEGPVFVSVGAIEPRKDPLVALEALELLREQAQPGLPSPQWIWIGDPAYGGKQIMERIRVSPAASSFHLAGYLDRDAIKEITKRATALVYPSRYEGFGLPPLEAMAEGIPVVVSDIPPLREVCSDAALYTPPGDASALADILRRLINEPELRAELGRKGRDRAAQFTWRRAGEATERIYQEAVGAKGVDR